MPEGVKSDFQEVANKVFETIAMAKVSTSAEEAKELNFLTVTGSNQPQSGSFLYDAKQGRAELSRKGLSAAVKRKFRSWRNRLCGPPARCETLKLCGASLNTI